MHRINVVELYDEKYNKSGIYHADSCWDNKNYENDVMSLAYCLAPINDIKYFSRNEIIPDKDEMLFYLYNDQKPMEMLSTFNQNVGKFISIQKLVEEKSLRKKFAENILSNLQLTGQTDKLESMKDILSTTPFKSSSIEYSFLRHATNKIINTTCAIEYSDYINALTTICTLEGKNILQSKKYIDEVVSKTLSTCYEKFVYGAKNPFYTLSCEKHKVIEEFKQKHKDALLKHKSKTNANTKE